MARVPAWARALIIIGALALALRLLLTLTHDGLLGVDVGAYLLSKNAVLGNEPTGADFPRPPLAPGWLLVPFTGLLGDDNGYKVWGALFSMVPAVPVFLLTRRYVGDWPAVFAVGFLAVDLAHAEMIVTGALPLIGFGLLGLAWWAVAGLAESWDRKKVLVLVAVVGLLPYVNQTSTGLAAITLPVFIAALALYNKDIRGTLKRTAPPLAAGAVLGAGAAPWYLGVAPGSGLVHYPGPWLFLASDPSVWMQFFVAFPLGLWLAVRSTGPPVVRSLGVVIVVLALGMVWLSTDETIINLTYRSRYLLALPFYVCISWVVFGRWIPFFFGRDITVCEWCNDPRFDADKHCPYCGDSGYFERLLPAYLTPVIVVIGILMAELYAYSFNGQAGYSDMVRPATADALELLLAEAPGEGIITNTFSMALAVSALNGVHSPHTSTREPPADYAETDQLVRCVLGWVPGCDPGQASQVLGIGYVLVDERFPFPGPRSLAVYGAPEDPWRVTGEAPWLELVYAADTTKLWEVIPDGQSQSR